MLTGFVNTWACLNELLVNNRGEKTDRHSELPKYRCGQNLAYHHAFLLKFDLKNVEKYRKDTANDIAVKLAYIGSYEQSLNILRRLQKRYPMDYAIAANLGTVYELSGKNDSALIYIKEGMELNRQSHEGSEWVHVKILQAKLEIAKNPEWLKTNRVLNTGITLSSPRADSFFRKIMQIQYQLEERVPFTPFPDPILANVFNELGDLYSVQTSIESANVAYGFSMQYDPSDSYGAKAKMEKLQPKLKKHKARFTWQTFYYSCSGCK
jgi:tetratricopeptide (TPR) repeat protein